MNDLRRDVLAPRGAIAWLSGPGEWPGRWSWEPSEVLTALAAGSVVLSVDRQAEGDADHVHVTSAVRSRSLST